MKNQIQKQLGSNIFTGETKKKKSQVDVESYLSQIPKLFYCGNETLHKAESYVPRKATCCFTHLVGLPEHPATFIPAPFTPYQVDFFNKIDETEEYHKFHLNKGRQMGFTELILRIIQFRCFNKYAGARIIIITGTREKTTKKIMGRLKVLFRNIPHTVIKNKDAMTIEVINDTVIEGLPASEEAITGDTKIKCIFMDESAKWKLIDDTPVLNSILPIVRTNKSDLFLISTPKGPRGLFYKIYKDNTNGFMKLEYDIWHCKGNLYTETEIEEMLATTTEDPNSEYLCKFTVGEDSIFGKVEDEDHQDIEMWGDVDVGLGASDTQVKDSGVIINKEKFEIWQ